MLLAVPPLGARQALVVRGTDGARTRLDPPPAAVLLEAWSFTFAHGDGGSAFEPPRMYNTGSRLCARCTRCSASSLRERSSAPPAIPVISSLVRTALAAVS